MMIIIIIIIINNRGIQTPEINQFLVAEAFSTRLTYVGIAVSVKSMLRTHERELEMCM